MYMRYGVYPQHAPYQGVLASRGDDGWSGLAELLLAPHHAARGGTRLGCLWPLPVLCRRLWRSVIVDLTGISEDYPFSLSTTPVSPVSLRKESPMPLGGGGEARYFLFYFSSETSETG